ncbi:MAG: HAMP domain-containing histidine kinase [Alphaproteobacteria bacterium]|nr:HAMP domain-containing histidine kinase [Pseudomonadota bacterium]TDI66113.1 MAG: HAMP domain-containing histidine kinase [Alphaproteobacteria bacterium]
MASPKSRFPLLARSLSARLLVLTLFFVMLAEIFIFAPSIARFRLTWFQERIAAAHLATLSLKATPRGLVSKALERELLRHVQGYGVILQKPDSKVLMLSSDMPPNIDATIDLSKSSFFGLIGDAFATLFRTENRVLRVMGPSPQEKNVIIEVVLDEAPLREVMFAYGRRIMALSVAISTFTAVLVYLSLYFLMVVPMGRITSSMVAFREDPNDPRAAIAPSARGDEIGTAQRELATMQSRLRAALRQRQHLAALGEAVAKVNHDLRNMLATASLISERLAASDDPEVKKASPTLISALDRAVTLCTETLNYVQEPGDLHPTRFALSAVLAEVPAAVPQIADGAVRLAIDVPDTARVTADRDQLFRVFANLVRNSAEAGAQVITIAQVAADPMVIEIRDDGSGVPQRAQERLFTPFAGSVRAGGTGLGLAIAREVLEAHGGTIELAATGPEGTVFRLSLGDSAQGPQEAAR